jgi:hypothetical protein
MNFLLNNDQIQNAIAYTQVKKIPFLNFKGFKSNLELKTFL